MKINLTPIGNISNYILEELKTRLNRIFGCPVGIVPETCGFEQAHDLRQEQYLASALLTQLKASGAAEDEKVLGIVDIDLYAPRLNFVFGQADILSGTAIISLYRLRQEYYGLPSDKILFLNRITKEAIHELGHTFGLGHCPDSRCIMHFSNSLADTDWKQDAFCSQCRPKLIK